MVYAGCVLVEASLNLHLKHELGDIHKEHPHPPSIFHQSSMQTKVALRSRMKELPFKSHEQLIPRFAPTAKGEQETNHSFHSPRMHPYLILKNKEYLSGMACVLLIKDPPGGSIIEMKSKLIVHLQDLVEFRAKNVKSMLTKL